MQHPALQEGPDDFLDEERVATSARPDARAELRELRLGPEPVVEQNRGLVGGEGGQGETLDPPRPGRPIVGPRGRDQERAATVRRRRGEAPR